MWNLLGWIEDTAGEEIERERKRRRKLLKIVKQRYRNAENTMDYEFSDYKYHSFFTAEQRKCRLFKKKFRSMNFPIRNAIGNLQSFTTTEFYV